MFSITNGSFMIIACVYIQRIYSAEANYNFLHYSVNGVWIHAECASIIMHRRNFNNDMVWLRSFNEDMLVHIYLNGKCKELQLKTKQGNLTYKEYAECYTCAFNEAINKLKQKTKMLGLELKDSDTNKILHEDRSKHLHFTAGFFAKLDAKGIQQNIENDKDFIAELMKLLLMTYFDMLEKNLEFADGIRAYKTWDTLTSYEEFYLLGSYKKVLFDKMSYQIEINDKISESGLSCRGHPKFNIPKDKMSFVHYYIDLTAMIMDIIWSINRNNQKKCPIDTDQLKEKIIGSVLKSVNLLLKRNYYSGRKCTIRKTIVFDMILATEFTKLHFFDGKDKLDSICNMTVQLIPTIYSRISETHKIYRLEFLDQKEQLKLKVSCHASTKQFIEKYAMPDFSDIAKNLDAIFETRNGSKTFGVAKCRIIDSLVENILDKSYDRSKNNLKYKEAVEIISVGCNSCKRQDTRCEICAEFLREFEYVYAKIVSYCMTLEQILECNYRENIDELTKFVSSKKEDETNDADNSTMRSREKVLVEADEQESLDRKKELENTKTQEDTDLLHSINKDDETKKIVNSTIRSRKEELMESQEKKKHGIGEEHEEDEKKHNTFFPFSGNEVLILFILTMVTMIFVVALFYYRKVLLQQRMNNK